MDVPTERALAAGAAVGGSQGLPVARTRVVRDLTNVLVHLEPAPDAEALERVMPFLALLLAVDDPDRRARPLVGRRDCRAATPVGLGSRLAWVTGSPGGGPGLPIL